MDPLRGWKKGLIDFGAPPPRVKLHLVGVAVGVAEVGVIVSVVRDGKEMPAFTLKMTTKQLIKGTF